MGSGPMPPQLPADSQKEIDAAWDKALTPPENLDRQAFLDALIVSQAFQVGVDRLHFKSEKDYSDGLVVMEIHFDRAKPNEDRFDVVIRNKAGKEVRRLTYKRTEVETAFRDLHDPKLTNPPAANAPPAPPEEVKKRQDVQKRLAAVEKVFPKREEK
jgi:hypothetical protein